MQDRSHTPHRLQTTLTAAQEAVAVVLRKTLLVSIDDLPAVVREFLTPDVARSSLDRCLRRHEMGNLRDLQAKDPACSPRLLRGTCPSILPGVALRVARRRCDHFTKLDGATLKAAAASRTVSPAASRAIARTGIINERGLVIQAGLHSQPLW